MDPDAGASGEVRTRLRREHVGAAWGLPGHKVLPSEGNCEKRGAGPGDMGCKGREASRRVRRPGTFLWDRKGRGRKDGGSGGGDRVAGFQRCLRATSRSGTKTQGARSGPWHERTTMTALELDRKGHGSKEDL